MNLSDSSFSSQKGDLQGGEGKGSFDPPWHSWYKALPPLIFFLFVLLAVSIISLNPQVNRVRLGVRFLPVWSDRMFYIVVILACIAFLMILAVTIQDIMKKKDHEWLHKILKMRQRSWIPNLMMMVIFLSLITWWVSVLHTSQDGVASILRAIGTITNLLKDLEAQIRGLADDPSQQSAFLGYLFFAIFILFFGGIIGVGLWVLIGEGEWKKSLLNQTQKEELKRDLIDVIGESIEDVELQNDYRQAIIATYRRLEQLLNFYGIPRLSFQTPLEYMKSVLASLAISPSSIRGLTSLFEVAKFSLHDMKEEDKSKALFYLHDIKATLERDVTYGKL
ncbi:MAG: DUF4129 domain-containing protein [Candidatus Tectomicrobia bacterium]|nr:DUF4129 domain-containing protein [Candidatus Tectomicrobia bacterium]